MGRFCVVISQKFVNNSGVLSKASTYLAKVLPYMTSDRHRNDPIVFRAVTSLRLSKRLIG